MGDVQVAAYHHPLAGGEAVQIGPEIIFPAHPVVQAAQAVLAVGNVHAYQEEIFHFQGDHAALVVVFVDADAVGDV